MSAVAALSLQGNLRDPETWGDSRGCWPGGAASEALSAGGGADLARPAEGLEGVRSAPEVTGNYTGERPLKKKNPQGERSPFVTFPSPLRAELGVRPISAGLQPRGWRKGVFFVCFFCFLAAAFLFHRLK